MAAAEKNTKMLPPIQSPVNYGLFFSTSELDSGSTGRVSMSQLGEHRTSVPEVEAHVQVRVQRRKDRTVYIICSSIKQK